MYIYIREMPIGTYTPPAPPPLQIITQKKYKKILFLFFILDATYLNHKKCFFISISILGRSGVVIP